MLKLYICPECMRTRYVSKENITCYHCNVPMRLARLSYADYIKMSPQRREHYVNSWFQRIQAESSVAASLSSTDDTSSHNSSDTHHS